MGIGFSTMKKLMQFHTDTPISDKAVHIMIQYVEMQVKAKTIEADNIHLNNNELRKIQKIPQRKRITEEDIINATTQEVNS